MPSGGAGSASGSSGSAGRSSTRRKLPGDAAAEVMYLQPDEPEPAEKNDVAERFDEIDGIFGDDLADEPARPRRSKRRSRSSEAASLSSDRRPTSFPGVTFVEVFNTCRRKNCRVCEGANGSKHGPVAIAQPLDDVGKGGARGPLSDAAPSKRLPGGPAGPRPGAVGARDAKPPAPPERAEVADKPRAPPQAVEVADEPPAPAASSPSPTGFWTQVPEDKETTPLRATRPVGEARAPKNSPPTRPVQAKTEAAEKDASTDDLEWRGRVALDEHGFEFTVETGARSLGRHGPPRPLKDAADSATTDDRADDLQSRLDRILERAKRIGFTPMSHENARSYAPPTRSVDRQPQGGGPQ